MCKAFGTAAYGKDLVSQGFVKCIRYYFNGQAVASRLKSTLHKMETQLPFYIMFHCLKSVR